jgi:hypothetical protein
MLRQTPGGRAAQKTLRSRGKRAYSWHSLMGGTLPLSWTGHSDIFLLREAVQKLL